MLVFPLYAIITLPRLIWGEYYKNRDSIELISISSIWIGLWLVYAYIYGAYDVFSGKFFRSKEAGVAGAIFLIFTLIAIIFGIAFLYDFIKKKRKNKKPSILREFIKAKKERYCPKIEWEE
jgi:hypothetical protein